MEGLERMQVLAAMETATMPGLNIEDNKYARGLTAANRVLQMEEWAYKELFAGAIIDEKTGESLEYRELIKRPEVKEKWFTALANELGRLAQGIRDIKGTETIHFIPKSEIPKDRRRDITYGRIVVSYRPEKLEKNRARLTVGGDRITCLDSVSAPTADVPVIKLLWNSVLSTPRAKYFTMDISNFYLGTPMLTHQKIERGRISQMPVYTRTMEARVETSSLHSGG